MADVHLRADAAHTGSFSMTGLFTAVPPRQRVRRVRLFQITHIFRAEGRKLDGCEAFAAVLLNTLGISAESKGCQFLVVQISQAVTAAVYAGVSMHCLSTYSNRNG